MIHTRGTAAESGLAVALYEWLATYLLLLLGYVFAPVFIGNRISTIPEWFEVRFDVRGRILLAILCLLGSILTKISGEK